MISKCVSCVHVLYQLWRQQSRGRCSSVCAPNVVKAAVMSVWLRVCVCFLKHVVCRVWWFGKQLVRRVLTHRSGTVLWEIRHPCVFVFVCVCVGPLVCLVMPVSLVKPQRWEQWQGFLLITFSLAQRPLCCCQRALWPNLIGWNTLQTLKDSHCLCVCSWTWSFLIHFSLFPLFLSLLCEHEA